MNDFLQMKDITKIYDNGIVANQAVNFSLRKGEIHAIAGENGAGKSTIMKILYGIEKPTSGEILIRDQKVIINSPVDALRYNIGMVHQHFMLVDNLTISENIFLGMEITKGLTLDHNLMNQLTMDYAEKYDMEINPNELCGNISVSVKQKVEILKVLVRGAKIIILDEPTAVLTPQETDKFFKQLQLLKQDNYTIVIITHKLNEIKAICDRVTIMRQGRDCGVYQVKDISLSDISRLMIGSDVSLDTEKKQIQRQRKILSVQNLEVVNSRGKKIVDNVSFDAYEGEVLCFAGVEGNGQNETIQCLAGLIKEYNGQITIINHDIKKMAINEIRSLGLAYISDDRMMQGVNQNESILDNLISYKLNQNKYVKGGFIDYKKLNSEAIKILKNYGVKYDNLKQPIKMLSGGNIQKIVIARELENNPSIILANQPTRGVDVGAIELIHHKLINFRDMEKAIVLVSADLNEVFNLADRILVFYNGQITAEITDVKNFTEEELGLYMLGLKRQEKRGNKDE